MIQRKFDPLHPIAAQNWWVTKVQLETDATLSGTQQDLAPNGVLFGEIKAFSWLNFTSCYSSFIVSFIGVCNNVADALVVHGTEWQRWFTSPKPYGRVAFLPLYSHNSILDDSQIDVSRRKMHLDTSIWKSSEGVVLIIRRRL